MRIPRFIIRPSDQLNGLEELALGRHFFLPLEETHHLKKVLRLSPNDKVEIFHIESEESYLCKIISLENIHAELLICEKVNRAAPPQTHLLMGLIKTDLCDYIVEKAVEIGISSITFFGAERSQEKLRAADKQEKRVARWQRIAEAALKQSGAAKLPTLSIEKSLQDALRTKHPIDSRDDEFVRRLILLAPLHPTETPRPPYKQVPKITEYFAPSSSTHSHTTTPLEKVAQPVDSYILIGPEGGFTDDELHLASNYCYSAASLGANVLRAETAVVAALTFVALQNEN